MRVETTPQVQNLRKSVRITTQFTYTGGLVIMDATHMPQGCGTWPAAWETDEGDWPNGGEVDIVSTARAVSRTQNLNMITLSYLLHLPPSVSTNLLRVDPSF